VHAPDRPWRRARRRLLLACATAAAVGLASPAGATTTTATTAATTGETAPGGTDRAAGPVAGFGSLGDVTRVTRAQDAWRAGITGRGVDVAVIDSGVAPVAGLTSGNVLDGPDLSFESQDPATARLDTFGHGTHMASIIAGRDAPSSPAGYADPARLAGMAPDSRVVSLKVATSDGAADVSQVVAAVDWVSRHAHDPGLDIRVLNLSFGTDSLQDAAVDPLVYAVEAAWRRGIVVVAAGGNEGVDRTVLTDPAMSARVLAVGAEDPQGTVTTADDTVPDFASRGSYTRHVDLVAPGVRVLGLAVPGSTIAEAWPQGRVGDRFQRGSGTSQAAAVTSGAAALYLQKYPAATPDQVKRALVLGAVPFKGASSTYRGAGALDVSASLAIAPEPGTTAAAATPGAPASTGTGSLEAARGGAHVTDHGIDLVGEQDVFGRPFVSRAWAPLAAAGRSWVDGDWNGSTWTGSGWTATTWAGAAWGSATWSGTSWSGRTWTGRTWSGRTWTGAGWSAGSWAGTSWSSTSWSSSSWSGRTWTGRTWTGAGWGSAAWD
jgi:serine protease AprX